MQGQEWEEVLHTEETAYVKANRRVVIKGLCDWGIEGKGENGGRSRTDRPWKGCWSLS